MFLLLHVVNDDDADDDDDEKSVIPYGQCLTSDYERDEESSPSLIITLQARCSPLVHTYIFNSNKTKYI